MSVTCVLDVDVLLALAWPQHELHAAAHVWFEHDGRTSWATCPATQIAFVQASTDPSIVPDAVAVPEALGLLSRMIALPGHRFWRDHVALSSPALLDGAAAIEPRHLLAAYLIELARRNEAVLATFDPLLPGLSEALGGTRHSVVLLPGGKG